MAHLEPVNQKATETDQSCAIYRTSAAPVSAASQRIDCIGPRDEDGAFCYKANREN